MKRLFFATIFAGVAAYGQPWGQVRQAEIRGGGGDGKCTIEVVVDGTAEVEVNQTSARIRTLAGQPAQWRRFQCNQPIPANAGLRFRGIDGRGSQNLVNSRPGLAVVRIEDRQGGSEGYTFDLEWGGGGGGYGGGRGPDRGPDRGPIVVTPDRGPGGSGGGGVWTGRRGGTLRFHGDGKGFFNRREGEDMVVRDVNVTVNRDGHVTVEFEARGFQRLVFTGQATQISRDLVSADLIPEGFGTNARGTTSIYIDRGEVERITMEGRLRGDRFRLNWSAR